MWYSIDFAKFNEISPNHLQIQRYKDQMKNMELALETRLNEARKEMLVGHRIVAIGGFNLN